MAIRGREELIDERRKARRASRTALMSDTKWRKLIVALDQPAFSISECTWKLVGRPDEVRGNMLRSGSLYLSRPWIDTLDFGPMPFRSIEWLFIPRRTSHGDKAQDVDAALTALGTIGQFPVEADESGIKVFGYLPATQPG